jgi:eukaryotic-like serine/threonine-protein kinase
MSETSIPTGHDDPTATVSARGHDEGHKDYISIDDFKAAINLSDDRDLTRFGEVRTIGMGGIGSVMSGHDDTLAREVAIKILRPAYRNRKPHLERFIREARATAQIAHPNIVPVHEMGVFDDVGPFFTMKRVEGETLKHVLRMLELGIPEYRQSYSLHHLLEIYISACNGVAYAHSRGIVHRDLKPANIMLGGYGEVMVMDWGLVKFIGPTSMTKTQTNMVEFKDELKGIAATTTIDGSISGTPAFMSPEQALGNMSTIDERTDLYSLGAILYCILTHRRSPYDNHLPLEDVLQRVVDGDFLTPRKRNPKLKIPKELNAICLKAMSFLREDRYASVRDLIQDVRHYLEGIPVSAYPEPLISVAFKRIKRYPLIPLTAAVSLFTLSVAYGAMHFSREFHFKNYMQTISDNIANGNLIVKHAKSVMRKLEEKRAANPSKNKSDRELQLEEELARFKAEFNNNYDAAMELLIKTEETGLKRDIVAKKIAEIYNKRIDFSIRAKDYVSTKRMLFEIRMKNFDAYSKVLGHNQVMFRKINQIRSGKTSFLVNTQPVPASFQIQPVSPGLKPLKQKLFHSGNRVEKVPTGSYLLLVKAVGYPMVKYPIKLEPANEYSLNIFLPERIPDETVYIPAGPFTMGSRESMAFRKHIRDLPGFFIKKYEITFTEYLEFWKSLKDPVLKEQYMSKFATSRSDHELLAWNKDGVLRKNLSSRHPVTGITREGAEAYCRWISKKINLPCQLPTAAEWEKAARGTDGRKYVWGNDYKSENALTLENRKYKKIYPVTAPPGSFPKDVSIYGVCDMGGNVREYTSSRFSDDLLYQVKGSGAFSSARFLNCSTASYAGVMGNDIGFRYVIPLSAITPKKKKTAKKQSPLLKEIL